MNIPKASILLQSIMTSPFNAQATKDLHAALDHMWTLPGSSNNKHADQVGEDCVAQALGDGADPNALLSGRTPLGWAVRLCNPTVVHQILQSNCAVNLENSLDPLCLVIKYLHQTSVNLAGQYIGHAEDLDTYNASFQILNQLIQAGAYANEPLFWDYLLKSNLNPTHKPWIQPVLDVLLNSPCDPRPYLASGDRKRFPVDSCFFDQLIHKGAELDGADLIKAAQLDPAQFPDRAKAKL